MLYEFANAREVELRSQARIITHRMEWQELSRIEQLEGALRTASARLSLPFNREALAR